MEEYGKVLESWNNISNEIEKYQTEPITETDTRCKIIDPILIDVLMWDESLIKREPKVEAGYIDYYCKSQINRIVIEAKRTSVPFKMPHGKHAINSKQIPASCAELCNAIEQARGYAKEKDCEFCVVSNGLNIIITKTYPSADENDTLIFIGKQSISANLHLFYEILSPYKNGTKFFREQLGEKGNFRSEPQFQKSFLDEQYSKDKSIGHNPLASQLGPYLNTYFSDISKDSELIKELYCDTENLSGYGQEIRKYIRERVPFYSWSVEKVPAIGTDKQSAGAFGTNYKLQCQNNNGHVYLLIGHLGSGKSTFLNRFYNYILDEHTRKSLVWLNIDFQYYFKENESVTDYVSRNLEECLRKDYAHLHLKRWDTLNEIYKEEITEQLEGIWFPYKDSEKINEKISDFLDSKTKDKLNHLKQTLKYIHKRWQYETCLVLDNVDQHAADVQEQICHFAVTQAKDLNCLVIVSLRDETYWNIKTRLPMDAYGNMSAYQIIPPDVLTMFEKRLSFVKSQVENTAITFDAGEMVITAKLRDVFDAIKNTVNVESTHDFFEKITSGNMRLALENFRTLMTSGHTNLPRFVFNNIAVANTPKILLPHEVIKSIALGNYEYYNSQRSGLINLFRVNDDGFFSHFITFRILETLKQNRERNFSLDIAPGYMPINELYSALYPYCRDETALRYCLIPLLRHYIVDSDIGSRKIGEANYFDKIKCVKLTPAGNYYITDLVYRLEYLQLIIYDTQITCEKTFYKIMDNLLRLRSSNNPAEYWSLWFSTIEMFLDYLQKQEDRDFHYLKTSGHSPNWSRLTPAITSRYQERKNQLEGNLRKRTKEKSLSLG